MSSFRHTSLAFSSQENKWYRNDLQSLLNRFGEKGHVGGNDHARVKSAKSTLKRHFSIFMVSSFRSAPYSPLFTPPVESNDPRERCKLWSVVTP